MKNRILQFLLTLMLVLFVPLCIKGWPTDAAPLYTYTVTISAGNQGSFPNESGIGVDNTASGSDYQIKNDGKTIRITGLQYGDVVSCNAPGMTKLSDNSKYYVKGIRESGRDNNTVSASAFKVTKDTDYVVAYGIPGELTEYSIYFVDEDGAELAPSQTYFGNVGDEPVIAYLYIDGYVPATYTESQKLVSDASKNVFIFVYMRATREEAGNTTQTTPATARPAGSQTPAPSPQVITTEVVVEETEVVTVTEEPTYVEETEPVADDDSNSDDDKSDADTKADDANKGFFATIGDAIGGALSKIGDAVTPLANFVKDTVDKMAENGTLVPAIIGLIALVALIIILILFLKRRKKDDEEAKAKSGKKDSAGEQKTKKAQTEKTQSENSETDKK